MCLDVDARTSAADGMVHCPLCACSDISVLESVNVEALRQVYDRVLRVSIEQELPGRSHCDFLLCLECGLRFFNPALAGSEALYESLQRLEWYYSDWKPEYEYARPWVQPTDAVLEVGCGTGAFARLITCGSYLGLELSHRAAEAGREQGTPIRVQSIQDHARERSDSYDVVCGFQVLEHVADLRPFLEAAVSCTRPGGLLVFSVPNSDSFLRYVVNGALNLPPHHISWWNRKSLDSVAALFDLEIVSREQETLADAHLVWWLHTVLLRSMNRLTATPRRLIDLSRSGRAKSAVAAVLARFLGPVLSPRFLRPIGHSVTYVYRKRHAAGYPERGS